MRAGHKKGGDHVVVLERAARKPLAAALLGPEFH